MLTFNVGPSKVYPQIKEFLQDAYNENILSMPHRSQQFMDMMKKTIFLLKQKLHIPTQYTIVFASSATECWEMISQSLISKKSYHLINGAFGEKWYNYTHAIHRSIEKHHFEINENLDVSKVQTFFAFAERRTGKAELEENALICFTQNETSNGTQIPMSSIEAVHQLFPRQLIAIDATSSMAGISFQWRSADVWFASVQKCFGLPAGLAVMMLSPRAIARVAEIGEKKYYNSLSKVCENIEKFQTTHTPNVLGIYLLMRVLENISPIKEVETGIKQRAKLWYQVFDKHPHFKPLIKNESVRSDTVIAVKTHPEHLPTLKERAKKAGFLLGNGYDKWKETTFRIANFPAISNEETLQLRNFIEQYQP
ncbi:MAG: phosphoserine transaminase [Raineya sp.]